MAITNASRLADFGSGIGTEGAVLQFNNATQRVGIGTTNPQTTLDVNGTVTAASLTSGIITTTSLTSGIITTTSLTSGIITTTSLTVGGITVSSAGVGIATAGGTVGTGVTLIDLRGAGISTVTVSSGIATVNVEGGGGGGFSILNYILN